ncbi:hypothetical protein Tco_0745933 [Tanacetum coccineum]
MTTLAERMIVAGAENRPPMLEIQCPLVYPLGETLYEYYWRFSQLINDMHTIGMTIQQVQFNTKFLNALPPEWSKFATDVKLEKSLYTTNYDQLYAYLSQHQRHANEVCIMRERYSDPVALQGEDPINCINKAMAFLSAMASRFPPSNNQLRTYSNPRNQATIQDVIMEYLTYTTYPRLDELKDHCLTLKNMPYPHQRFAVYNTLVNEEEQAGFTPIRHIHHEDTTYLNAGRQNRNQAFNAGNGLTQIDESHYARDCQKPIVHDENYFREQMLLAMKDEAGSNLKDEENDFMLDNSYGDETLEELTAAAVSEVNASHKVREQENHVKRKTIIHASDDDQIDSNIIFDDPYVENNGGTSEHDSNAHDEYHTIQILA